MPMNGVLQEVHSADDVVAGLRTVDYIADTAVGVTVHLASRLGKPILAEGPAGVGKTALAKALSAWTGRRIIRLQCHEGLDESKALYDWDYRRQLLHVQAARFQDDAAPVIDLFDESFLLPRPLLESIRAEDDVILLVDEVDRLDAEAESLLLEVLSEFQVSVPELGTMSATKRPFVLLTSNDSRDLSEALKRRCLYLPLDYPTVERERQIVRSQVSGISEQLADEVARVVQALRGMNLVKNPSISETVDWARSLVLTNVDSMDADIVASGMPILLKHRVDIAAATSRLTDTTLPHA
ncbi:AAA family ATPase [Rhodococcus ruber]